MLSSLSPDGPGVHMEWRSPMEASASNRTSETLTQRMRFVSQPGTSLAPFACIVGGRARADPSATYAPPWNVPWGQLSPPEKVSAMALGFNEDSWDEPDLAPIKLSSRWDELDEAGRLAAEHLGWMGPVWDALATLRRQVTKLKTEAFDAKYNERAARHSASEQRQAMKVNVETMVASLKGNEESVLEVDELDALLPFHSDVHEERGHDRGRADQSEARNTKQSLDGAARRVKTWLAAKARVAFCSCLE